MSNNVDSNNIKTIVEWIMHNNTQSNNQEKQDNEQEKRQIKAREYKDKNLISNEIVSCATLIKVLTLRYFNNKNYEITPEQFVILDTIYTNKGLYQRTLGQILGKDRPNIARLISILEKKGLIKKEISSNGRQINNLELTNEGKNLRNKIFPVISKIRESYLDNIKQEELINCFNTLSKIKENISKNTKLQT